MPTTFYSEEEYAQLEYENKLLQNRVDAFETLQPVWLNEDSYMTAAALGQLWQLLGAKNQTEAVLVVKRLKGVI